MSEHVRDRLSALLDRELPRAEREAVEAHLVACAACAHDLDLLRAVDEGARALPLDVPAGYFDALPGRVRARLEKSTRRSPGLPVWTWAIAAVLLLAVVTPLTLRQAPALHETTPASAPPQTAPYPAPAQAAPSAGGAALTTNEPLGRIAAESRAQPPVATNAAPKARLEDQEARKDKAAVPELKRQLEADRDRSASESAPPDGARPVPARPRAPGPGGPSAQTQAPLQAPAAPAFAAPPPGVAKSADAVAEEEDVATRDEAQASQGKATEGAAAGKPSREGQGRVMRSFGPAEESLFYRLTTPVARTPGALRERREAWRAYGAEFPSSPRADEARVRVIETGAEAWRLSADPADLARVREDAAAYLSRRDAPQAPRVRAVLDTLPTDRP